MTTEFADVPLGETSVAARSLEKRLYSQASSVKKKKNEKAAQPREQRLLNRNQINLNILWELGYICHR